MNAVKLNYDCTNRCRSLQHGNAIVSSLMVKGASEAAKAAYMRSLCCNYCQITNSDGCTALHMAATMGCSNVVQWLAQQKDCNINAKDVESGFTALHRSVFYGQIHVYVNLIQLGANASVVDNEGLTALEHAMKDRARSIHFSLDKPCEVYVWGTNTNNTLGTGSPQDRIQPELLEPFRKQNISIIQVAMHKFHSVFVSQSGQVYSCGHGQGGRLGLGSEQSALLPSPMKLGLAKNLTPELCAVASISRDHSVLLTKSGRVLTCGLNSYHQLGIIPPPPHLLSPTLVTLRGLKSGPVGVCAARFHTVVWSPDGLLSFGLNAGQLGHPSGPEKTIVKPKLVSSLPLHVAKIAKVSSSDGATVVALCNGDVYVLHEYQCRRIASRLNGVEKVVVVGGHLDSTVEKDTFMERGGDALQVIVLTADGKLTIWQEASPQLTSCVFSLHRLVLLRDVAMTRHQLLLVTRDGEAFSGEIKGTRTKTRATAQSPKSSAASGRSLLEERSCVLVRLARLANVHRAVSITSDVKGTNFAVIQTHPTQSQFEFPEVSPPMMAKHMKNLMLEANEDDAIHDLVFQVGHRNFAAHQFIILSRNEYLGKLIAEQASKCVDKVVKVKLNNVQTDVFEHILEYIYTNACDLLDVHCDEEYGFEESFNNVADELSVEEQFALGIDTYFCSDPPASKTKRDENKSKRERATLHTENPLPRLQKAALHFQMQDLCKELTNFKFVNGLIVRKKMDSKTSTQPKWNRLMHKQLYDVVIRSEKGREVGAHKCILMSRLEYFHSMLSQGWIETTQKKTVLNLALPHNILEILLDFLYEDGVSPEVQESDDINVLTTLLVFADQLFVQRLKELCELSLIKAATMKNVTELMQMADMYNAKQLKTSCMEYINLNMSAVLESRSLECISPELLAEAARSYYHTVLPMTCRAVTPFSTAPTVETIEAAFNANPFKFDTQDSETAESDKKTPKQTKKKPRVRKNSNEAHVRTRNESTGSIGSEDLDQACDPFSFSDLVENLPAEVSVPPSISKGDGDKWVKIPIHSKQQKILQARLKAISASKESSFIAESSRESFTKLTRNTPSPSPIQAIVKVPEVLSQSAVSPPVLIQKVVIPQVGTTFDFPELSSPKGQHNTSYQYPKLDKAALKKPLVKVSQKERKRLTSLNDIVLMADHLDKVNQPPPGPPPPAWSRVSPEAEIHTYSLGDIMRQELKNVKPSPVALPITSLPVEVVPEKTGPVNPWAKIPEPKVASLKTVKFTSIVASEQKQKDNLTKMLSKPLKLTQIEDQAISDLLEFYNANGATDERITVHRVIAGPIAAPTWLPNH